MKLTSVFILCIAFSAPLFATTHNDPLPSWNEGTVKTSILNFVQTVTDKNSHQYVAPADRIATIDNDGTLWLEHPAYTQMVFMLDRYAQLAESYPAWKQKKLFKKIVNHQFLQLTKPEWEEIFSATSSGMSVDDYIVTVKKWLKEAENPRFKRHYTELVYQPMLELLQYLREHGFTVYIVSGGGQDFIRAFSQDIYHVPVEHVLGTTTKLKYLNQYSQPTLLRLPEILFICDKTGKPSAINLLIGKKPILAFGNSDGDREMLEWTQSNKAPHLMLLVHHDDAKREYAYDAQSKIGTFSASLLQEAQQNKWQVVSMKNDWKVIFPLEKQS